MSPTVRGLTGTPIREFVHVWQRSSVPSTFCTCEGNQRTQGERSRREGGKGLGSPTRRALGARPNAEQASHAIDGIVIAGDNLSMMTNETSQNKAQAQETQDTDLLIALAGTLECEETDIRRHDAGGRCDQLTLTWPRRRRASIRSSHWPVHLNVR